MNAGSPVRDPAVGDDQHLVGVLDHALEAVLGQDHGDAQVVHEALQCGQHLLGGARVQGGGRLVEDQDPRVAGERRADGHALALAARQRRQGPVAQVGQAEQVQGLLDPAAHGVRLDAQALHAVGQLVLDDLGDEPGQRVLADHAHDVGELARGVGAGVAPGDRDPAGTASRR